MDAQTIVETEALPGGDKSYFSVTCATLPV